MKQLLATLLLSLFFNTTPSALADNGVERGTVDFSVSRSVPSSVQNFLEKLIFGNCSLKGAQKIRPVYIDEDREDSDLGQVSARYRIEFVVEFKAPAATTTIHTDVVLYQDDEANSRIELRSISSPICRKPQG